MGEKLYPPYIEGTIPAFYNEGEGTVLTVPFSMNKTVNKKDVAGFKLKIKTVQSGTFLLDLSSSSFDLDVRQEVYFQIPIYGDVNKDKLKVGQFYKVQLAYVSIEGEIGYYSTVGIVKFTTKPSVTIKGLENGAINFHSYGYMGSYSQVERDSSEKEYSYSFTIYDGNNNIINTTGELLHNSSNDEDSYESYDLYKYPSELEQNKVYYIVYSVKTLNGLNVSSARYRLMQRQSIDPGIKASVSAEMNFENGYVSVKLIGDINEEGYEYTTSGKFVLSRASEDDNYLTWNDILKFTLRGQYPTRDLFKDFTVEQGKRYIYSIQQYNDQELYSNRILSNDVYVDFEDMFLYDGKKQLKIRFNPKVSSFKTDILEAKIETIGSKYPFIFRNGNVGYKEFPISGLISYWMDEENLFMTDEELGLIDPFTSLKRKGTVGGDISSEDNEYFNLLSLQTGVNLSDIQALKESYKQREEEEKIFLTENYKTTNHTSYNISAERKFKLAVLDWLNNGEKKLFRSPTEGNYIVRLLNNSLAPEDTLGRMLHNFSSTAYEVAQCSYQVLDELGIISSDIVDINGTIQTNWKTTELASKKVLREVWDSELLQFVKIYSDEIEYINGEVLDYPALDLEISDVLPGSKFFLQLENSPIQEIVIGATGTYKIDIGTRILSLKVPEGQKYTGLVTYKYEIVYKENSFNDVQHLAIKTIPAAQFYGYHENIINELTNIKEYPLTFSYLNFSARPVVRILESEINNIKENISVDPFTIYSYELEVINSIYCFRQKKGLTRREIALYPKDLYRRDENNFYVLISETERENLTSQTSEFFEKVPLYEKSKFQVYYDKLTRQTYMDEEEYELFMDCALAQIKEKYTNPTTIDFYLNLWTKDIYKFSKKFYIDGNEFSLEDIDFYEINTPLTITSLKLEGGVVLECGYDKQIINYEAEESGQLKKLKDQIYEKEKLLSRKGLDGYLGNEEEYIVLCEQARVNLIQEYQDYYEGLATILQAEEEVK